MEYVALGTTGLKVSRICLGTMTYGSPQWRDWVLPEDASRPIIKRALELGINFFDTADMYSLGASEAVLGRALQDFAIRKDVIVATKVYWPTGDGPNDRGLSRKHIMDSIDGSLRRLNTDYVDIYYIHRWDYESPIEETLEALDDLVRVGKVRYLGASSMHAWQFMKALGLADQHGWSRFVAMQNHYNLVHREEEREMMPLCRDEGIGVVPWSPMARGFLAGNRKPGERGVTARDTSDQMAHDYYFKEIDFAILERVVNLAREKGVKPAQIALAWLLHQTGVTAPVIGATTMNHLEEAVEAAGVSLSVEDDAYLKELYVPRPVLEYE
jgi:aryl-alcohol dehydrogenase-like predicted oxidoreductase